MTGKQVVLPIKGVRLAAGSAGLRYKNRDDIALIEIIGDFANIAVVLTQNKFPAAPIIISKEHLAQAPPKYLLINAGYANAGLGQDGLEDAYACCQALADLKQINPHQVLPFSTGVIGERMPHMQIIQALPELLSQLDEDQWQAVASAIMTTDTVNKCSSTSIQYQQGSVAITGIAKGSGMICPNMATMLGFIATDIRMDKDTAYELLYASCQQSFNCITVDGDTSTNDACVLIASGSSEVDFAALNADQKQAFVDALDKVTTELARKIVYDAEGAKHFVTIRVEEALTPAVAEAVARTVAHSPLVKTAIAGGDPNWGRIIAAIGRAGVDLEPEQVSLYIGDYRVFDQGMLDSEYTEEQGLKAMANKEIEIRILLGNGNEKAKIMTSDLTEEYIQINTDYRS